MEWSVVFVGEFRTGSVQAGSQNEIAGCFEEVAVNCPVPMHKTGGTAEKQRDTQ